MQRSRKLARLIFVTIYLYRPTYSQTYQFIMTFIRQNVGPLVILLIFLFALVATSARIFLPTDMSGPAPLTGSILIQSLLILFKL
jgi:hypothetical protein